MPVELLPDDALLAGFCDGDGDATVAFVRRFQAKVHGVALAVCADPAIAEDVAQQAFERAWRAGGTFDPRRGSVGGWLAATTRNLAIDTLRARRPVPVDTAELVDRVAGGTGTEGLALAGASAERLRAELRRLPPEQARAVVLAGIVGLTAQEVAASEGVPVGTAKTRIRTALRRLRQALATSEALDG